MSAKRDIAVKLTFVSTNTECINTEIYLLIWFQICNDWRILPGTNLSFHIFALGKGKTALVIYEAIFCILKVTLNLSLPCLICPWTAINSQYPQASDYSFGHNDIVCWQKLRVQKGWSINHFILSQYSYQYFIPQHTCYNYWSAWISSSLTIIFVPQRDVIWFIEVLLRTKDIMIICNLFGILHFTARLLCLFKKNVIHPTDWCRIDFSLWGWVP